MKTKFSKRILSLFLAVMMVVTSIPMFALTASAAGAYTPTKADDKYLFAYFTGDGDGQKIRFAVSHDGVNYYPLNNNEQILQHTNVSETITFNGKNGYAHDDGVRDPYIIKKPNADGYYIVATDLRVVDNEANTYNNSKLMVWDVPDISKADEVVPWNIDTWGMFANNSDYGTSSINVNYCAWAPEITYDYQKNMYMLFWSNGLYDSLSLYYVYTNDFKTFYNKDGATIDGTTVTPDILYQVSGTNTIDGDIAYDGSNYYLVFKHEYTGQIYFVKSSTPTGFNGQEPTKFVDSKYTGKNGGNGESFEGPELYQRGDGKWVLIVDNYTANPKCIFNMYVADSLDEFMNGTDFADKNIVTNINDCQPRHGGVAIIPSDICGSLISSYGNFSQYDDSQLKSLIETYETRMEPILSGSLVYKNLLPAYEAYVQARKAYDAYYYGGNTTVNLTTYAYFLQKAIDAMTAWTQYTANNPRPTFPSGTVPDSAFANLLYTRQANTNSAFIIQPVIGTITGIFSTYTHKNEIQVGYNETVMMYDGPDVTPKAPVMFVCRFMNGGGATRESSISSVYPTTASGATNDFGELYLPEMWYSSGSSAWNFENEYGKTSYRTGHNSSTINNGKGMRSIADQNTSYVAYANVIQYQTSTSWAAGEYSKEYKNLNWNCISYFNYDGNRTNATGSVNDNATIYVVNYKVLTDAIKNCFAKLPENINDYKQGGLSAILGAIDNATGYDPNSSFFGVSSAYAGVTNFNNKVSALIDKLNLSASKDVDEDKYQALREEMDKHITNSTYPSKETYTSDSVDKYINDIYPAAQSVMRDVLENGYTKGTNAGLDDIALEKVLNPIMDKSALQAEIANKDNPVIFDESGNQTKTYASWLTVNTALTEAKQVDETITAQYQTGNAFYADANSTDLPYSIITTDNTQAVTDATTNLQNANLVDIDTVGYPSFDAAKTVVDSIDRAKYTTSALEAFDRAVSDAKDLVYYTPTADEISAYNDNTEGTDITGDLKISTSLTNTDAATIALLNAVNTLNTVNEDGTQPNVNKYSAKIYDSDKNYKETISKYYGDTFKYNVGETLEDGDVVTWVVTVYANDTDLEKATADEPDPTVKPIRSQVVSNYNGITIERTANGSMCIQYIIDKGTAVDQLTYKIYNAYGNVIDVLYGSEGAYDDAYFRANYPDPVLPFYTFKEWSVSVADNGVVKVKPVFDETPTKTVTVDTNYATISFNKMSGGKAVVGATATITGNKENIYGWAVATGGKYQIVGYGKDYKFNVFADESYVPIIKTESGYQINGTDLTADMVAGFSNNSNGNLSDNAYLAAKLDAKAPFVYYQTNSDFYDKGVSKTKVYVRITAGSGIDNLAYGLQINGNKFVSTAKNEGGQFYMTMKTASYNGVTENNMSAYVSYTFPYTFKDETAYITTIDYAKIK